MQGDNTVEYTIEIDVDQYLCNIDNIQEITFEFINPSSVQNLKDEIPVNERIIDIDLDELRKEDANIKEVSAEINREDTIIKTSNGHNSKDEIDILQMDEKSSTQDSTRFVDSINDQVSLETQIEI